MHLNLFPILINFKEQTLNWNIFCETVTRKQFSTSVHWNFTFCPISSNECAKPCARAKFKYLCFFRVKAIHSRCSKSWLSPITAKQSCFMHYSHPMAYIMPAHADGRSAIAQNCQKQCFHDFFPTALELSRCGGIFAQRRGIFAKTRPAIVKRIKPSDKSSTSQTAWKIHALEKCAIKERSCFQTSFRVKATTRRTSADETLTLLELFQYRSDCVSHSSESTIRTTEIWSKFSIDIFLKLFLTFRKHSWSSIAKPGRFVRKGGPYGRFSFYKLSKYPRAQWTAGPSKACLRQTSSF